MCSRSSPRRRPSSSSSNAGSSPGSPRLAPGQPLSRLAGWANKLNGACVRIAAALHVGDQLAPTDRTAPDTGGSQPNTALVPVTATPPGPVPVPLPPIPIAVVRRAVRLCRDYFVPHALAAFDIMSSDRTLAGARRVWAWVVKERLVAFTARDAFMSHRAAFDKMDELQPCLDLLERHFLIRAEPSQEPRGRGRPPSPRYEVNPRALPGSDPGAGPPSGDGPNPPGSGPRVTEAVVGTGTHNPHNSQNSADVPGESNSAYSVLFADGTRLLESLIGLRPSAATPEPATKSTSGAVTADSTVPVPESREPEIVAVTAPDGLTAVVEAVKVAGRIGLDTETTGLDPQTDRARLIQIATPETAYVIDVLALPDVGVLAELLGALSGAEVIGHNLQFDLRFLAPLGFVPGCLYDTMLASQVLHAGRTGPKKEPLKHGLADVLARELGHRLDKSEQESDWSGVLTEDQIRYAARAAAVLLPLAAELGKKLSTAGLTRTTELEMRALPAVAWLRGVPVDRAAWLAQGERSTAERGRLIAELDGLVPATGPTNWNSAQQIVAQFKRLGIPLESTADEVLATVDHPLAAKLREYRGAAKRVSSYGRKWAAENIRTDDRVWPSWWQLSQVTGRIGCSAPNLQQVPNAPEYRRCFAAPAGSVLVKADYSQIELRIAAKVANDTQMLAAYRDGADLHARTAAAVLGKPEGAVTKADRSLAKALNFGLLYGMGADTLRQYARTNYGVTLNSEQAEAYRTAFFRAYPELRRWQSSVSDAEVDTRTLGGRRRLGVGRFTEKLNSPVQGTGADGLKAAIALLWARRAECPNAVPVLYVHDEIVVEVPEGDAESAKAWLVRAMTDGMAPLIDPVSVVVETSAGRTWAGD